MKVAFIGLGVMGYPDGGPSGQGGPRGRGLQPHAGQGRALGGRARRRAGADRGRGGRRAARWWPCAWAMTTTCARCVAEALPAMAAGGGGGRSHHHLGQAGARDGGRGAGPGPLVRRRAGVRRPGRAPRPGQLSVMAGGDEAAVERAEPVIGAYAKAIARIGGPGAGQLAKMVNQICIAGVVQGLAEAVHFAKPRRARHRARSTRRSPRARPSPGRWTTAGRPWSRASSTSASRSTGCARTWGWCWTRRARNGASLALTALVDQFYAEVQAMGGRRWDTSSLAGAAGARAVGAAARMMVLLLVAAVVLAGLGLGRVARRARSTGARAAAGYAAVGLCLAAGLLVLNLEARAWPGLYVGGSRLLSQLLGGRPAVRDRRRGRCAGGRVRGGAARTGGRSAAAGSDP